MTTQDETEIQNDFSNIFTKHFAAEGVVHRHELLFASSTESEDKFFSNLPEINREEEKSGKFLLLPEAIFYLIHFLCATASPL